MRGVNPAAPSPAIERVTALLSATFGRALSEHERAEWFALPPLVEPSQIIDRVDGPWPAEPESVQELSPFFVRAIVRGPDEARYACRVAVASEPPHRIRYVSRWRAPEDVTTRLATDDDDDQLAALERRTPIIDDDVRRSYDRRGGWFDQLRLMENTTVVVAEIGDRIVGVHVDSIHDVNINGPRRLLYRLRTRVDPEYQGRHIWPALNGAAVDARLPHEHTGWGFDSEEMFVALGNERLRSVIASQVSSVREWATPIERLVITCADAEPGGPIDEVTPTDLQNVTTLLCGSRSEEVGWPYRAATDVQHRFERAPSVYGWANVLRLGDAILGIWNERLGITVEAERDRRFMSCAVALDYGCAPSRTADLVELISSACVRLLSEDVTHLILFTSPGAYLRDVLAPLAGRVERFGRRTRVPEPSDCSGRGVYVDPIYF
jgi:hypothetical protein